MFIVKFQGGLGNQMFQYAFLENLKKQFPGETVKADLSSYILSDYHNGYELKTIFGINVEQATDEEVFKFTGTRVWRYGSLLYRIYSKMKKYGWNKRKKSETGIIYITEDNYNKKLLNKADNAFFEGVWANDKYYVNIKDNIRNVFPFNDKLKYEFYDIVKEMEFVESVGIHIRRGDYVGTCFDVLTDNYYKKAIAYICERIDNPKFYFFSDDVDYIKGKYSFLPNSVFIQGNTGSDSFKDMFLMSICKNNIIANSTFSYWAAELNNNSEKIVIAPKVFSNSRPYPIAASNWILCDN